MGFRKSFFPPLAESIFKIKVLMKQSMSGTLIIEINKGGLGDHLFYSHLPRIAKETKAFEKVLISNHSHFRHADYKKLIWELNPFVDGFTEEKGIFHFSTDCNEDQNMLDTIMLAYGLDDGNRMHEPEIYYHPKINPAIAHLQVYDPNYQSYTGNLRSSKLIEQWLFKNHISIDYQMRFLGKRQLPLPIAETLSCKDIFEFCDLIASIKQFYCVNTGSTTLAAALHKKAIVFYGKGLEKGYRHSPLHDYIFLGSDYTILDHCRKWLGFCYYSLFKKD